MLIKMPAHQWRVLVLVALLSLSACKTWHKLGADHEDLTADQQRCENETGTSAGVVFVECMERAGWYHSNMTAKVTEPDSVSTVTDEKLVIPLQGQSDNESPQEAIETGDSAPDNDHTPELSHTRQSGAGIRRVEGWAQLGADSDQLEEDKAQCHATAAGSEAFSGCMQSKGWTPLAGGLSTQGPSGD